MHSAYKIYNKWPISGSLNIHSGARRRVPATATSTYFVVESWVPYLMVAAEQQTY